MNQEEIAARLRPTPDERERMQRAAAALEAACDEALQRMELTGHATVQGSVAKDTWIAGSNDLDLFLLLAPETPEERLEEIATTLADGILDGARRKYAQHPYLVGGFQGFDVDLVPAYAVAQASDRMSAVDRTPFHTAWVREHLDEEARQDVRLLKQWCKGTGLYGAETATAGFSGYLLEVLVGIFGSFGAVLAWFAQGPAGARIAVGDDRVEDDVSPLVVVDPVDPTRNCAAAVATDTLTLTTEAAQAYLASPDERFFFPRPPRPEPPATLHEAQASRCEAWCAVALEAQTDRLDIVLPQFQKAARAYAAELERTGFPVHRHRVEVQAPAILFQFVTTAEERPPSRRHVGPAADREPNARRFRAKWDGHPDAAGPVEVVDGQLQVQLVVRDRLPHQALATALQQVHVGKHVRKAVGDEVLHDPAAVADLWAPAVADLVLDRRPWQR